jgi:hypothetical protein
MLKPLDCVRTSTSCTFNKNGDAFGVVVLVDIGIFSVSPIESELAIELTSTSRDDIV